MGNKQQKCEKCGLAGRVEIAVARSKPGATLMLIVISTLPQSKARAGKARKTPRRDKFWLRKANSELDRAGDWLLGNLAAVRAQAASRAHSR